VDHRPAYFISLSTVEGNVKLFFCPRRSGERGSETVGSPLRNWEVVACRVPILSEQVLRGFFFVLVSKELCRRENRRKKNILS